MINIERFHKYIELLESRRYITAEECEHVLEISHATFKRDLSTLRDRLNIPIFFDRDIGGYKIDRSSLVKPIPGLWFTQSEVTLLKILISEHGRLPTGNKSEAYLSLSKKISSLT